MTVKGLIQETQHVVLFHPRENQTKRLEDILGKLGDLVPLWKLHPPHFLGCETMQVELAKNAEHGSEQDFSPTTGEFSFVPTPTHTSVDCFYFQILPFDQATIKGLGTHARGHHECNWSYRLEMYGNECRPYRLSIKEPKSWWGLVSKDLGTYDCFGALELMSGSKMTRKEQVVFMTVVGYGAT